MSASCDLLSLREICQLDVSAASGLCALPDRLCVVADDEHFLASYDFAGRPLSKLPLFVGDLPEPHAERKRQKPDLEALTRLPGDRLLALGSGSTERRRRAAVVDLRTSAVTLVDLTALYLALELRLPELNIEGAAVLGERLWLAHRGNGRARYNACVELQLSAIESLLGGARELTRDAVCAIHPLQLGELDGVPLGVTDLAALPPLGLVFCAAAEDSADTYLDGVCAGSVVGTLDLQGRVGRIASVDAHCKLEGIAVGPHGGAELFLVADPDDRSRRAPLFHISDASALWR